MNAGVFGGSIVAVVTPMAAGGAVDNGALRTLLEWHIASGSEGIVVAGTTGESPTLSVDEHQKLIADAVDIVGGRIAVIAGVGANATAEAVNLARRAKADGADAGLSVVPYYNKPEQEGLYRHFCQVADVADFPVYLYDVPGRCACSFADDTLLRLSAHGNIAGLKDATGDVEVGKRRMELLPDDFVMLSGDDKTACAFMLAGGGGVISVTANVAPAMMRKMTDAARKGDTDAATAADNPLAAFHRAQSAQSNPIPVKFALADGGKIPPGIRLPLTPLAAEYHPKVREAARGLS
ncbi:MAG: 4-hydroxy-tetrahydrodipicolinate synthase [Gammaproteobacteria bacterium]